MGREGGRVGGEETGSNIKQLCFKIINHKLYIVQEIFLISLGNP